MITIKIANSQSSNLTTAKINENTLVRRMERNLNIPRDLIQQLDKGEILPFSSTAKSIGQTIGEKLTGQPEPKILTASESIAQLTGVELPSIPEIKLERPFEYQTAKYQNDGKTGEDLGATAIDLILLRRGMMKSQINSPQSLNLEFPLKNGTAGKIGVVNAQTELDPLIARQVGQTISENSVATKAYSQMQRNGTEVNLDFGVPPQSNLFGQYFRPNNKMEIYMQNNVTAKNAVATMVHESSHGRSIQLKRSFGTKFDEFRAFTREFLFTKGRRPTLQERQDIWQKIQIDYWDKSKEKNPFTGIREK